MANFINSSAEKLAYKADLSGKRPLNLSKIVSQRGTRLYARRGSAAINSADRIVKFERNWEERDSGRPPCLKRGFYSGPGTNPAARMVVDRRSLGRPDNHNLTGRFNEPYARHPLPPPLFPTLGWSFNYSRYPRTLGYLPPPPATLRPYCHSLSSTPSSLLYSTIPAALTGRFRSRSPSPARVRDDRPPPLGIGITTHSSHVLVPILNRRDGREIIKTYNRIEIVSLSINAIRRLRASRSAPRPLDRFNLVSTSHV